MKYCSPSLHLEYNYISNLLYGHRIEDLKLWVFCLRLYGKLSTVYVALMRSCFLELFLLQYYYRCRGRMIQSLCPWCLTQKIHSEFYNISEQFLCWWHVICWNLPNLPIHQSKLTNLTKLTSGRCPTKPMFDISKGNLSATVSKKGPFTLCLEGY